MTAPQQQRRKMQGPVVITANRLWDGAVIYRMANGGWTNDLVDAAIITNPDETHRLLASALADERNAVGAYAAPVDQDCGAPAPANRREHICRSGPTIPLSTSRIAQGSPDVHPG